MEEQLIAAGERLTGAQKRKATRGSKIRLTKKPQVSEEGILRRSSRISESIDRPSPRDFERILGTNDLVDMNYMSRAQRAGKAVCRIIIRDATGREVGYGTGFKVAPRLLLTNNHVLRSLDEATEALCEFEYELDIHGIPSRTTRFELAPNLFFMTDVPLDFSLIAIQQTPVTGIGSLDDYGFHRLIRDTGKINQGEFMTIIQHPSGQPKQIALRENQLIEIKEQVLLYGSDTAPGSSGAPVFNDTWQIVGLHHSGVPRTDANGRWLLKDGTRAGPDSDDSDIDWLANEGIRASRIVNHVLARLGNESHAEEFERVAMGDLIPQFGIDDVNEPSALQSSSSSTESNGLKFDLRPGGARVTVPLAFDVQLPSADDLGLRVPVPINEGDAKTPSAFEVTKEPIIDRTYGDRRGYKENFLGIDLPMPRPRFSSRVAKMENGEFNIPYQHFSIVQHKERRLALLTAANVDGRRRARRPEPDRPRSDYTRKALGGFAENDREKWLLEPRIGAEFQLPDRFYNKDRQSFDKGHLVRRDIVCWGRSYRQLQKANGDTYHCTNCSPQVLDFNRSREGGIWGQLENHVMRHAKTEKLSLFSGPVLSDSDDDFSGRDDQGQIVVKIPRAYWKIIVIKDGGDLKAYGFMLRQDLTSVAFEDFDPAQFAEEMRSIRDIERKIGEVRFPSELKDADQFGTASADELMSEEAFVDVVIR